MGSGASKRSTPRNKIASPTSPPPKSPEPEPVSEPVEPEVLKSEASDATEGPDSAAAQPEVGKLEPYVVEKLVKPKILT